MNLGRQYTHALGSPAAAQSLADALLWTSWGEINAILKYKNTKKTYTRRTNKKNGTKKRHNKRY